ncbi:MAG: CDP-alcohol phosphatidyltransferase family protein [Notoacmeibacter sp.]
MENPFIPIEPDGPPKSETPEPDNRGAKLHEIPVRKLIPNIITVLAICAGLTGIRLAYEGRFELAVAMVLVAAFLDGIDGRVARLIKGETRFGAEMDSLADIVNFGVAPAFVLHAYVLKDIKTLGWVAAVAYVIACALRLARFNVMNIGVQNVGWRRNYFVGVPAPMGAALVFLPFYLGVADNDPDRIIAVGASLFTLFIAFLLISRLPVWSGKSFAFKKDYIVPTIMGVAVFVLILASEPWLTLSLCVLAYLAFLPLSARNYWKRSKAEKQSVKPGAETV